jgi:hypothetical protein
LEEQVKTGTDMLGRRLGAHTHGGRDALRVGDGEGTLSNPFVEDKVLLAPQKQLAAIVRPGQVSKEHSIGADGDSRCATAGHQAGAAVKCNGRPDDVATLVACFGANRQRLLPPGQHCIEGRHHGRGCAAGNRANASCKAEQHVEDESWHRVTVARSTTGAGWSPGPAAVFELIEPTTLVLVQ